MKKRVLRILSVTLLSLLFLVPAALAAESGDVLAESVIPDSDLPSNEALFAGYVDKQFYPERQIATFGISGRAQLNPLEQEMYDLLKAEIEKVAAGKLSCTQFTVYASQFKNGTFYYTASELGYSSMSDAALKEATARFTDQYNFSKLLSALLHDCPYELYWYDKSATSYAYYSYSYSNTYCDFTKLTFQLPVAASYAVSSLEANTDKTSAASTAVVNANAIVEQYKGSSDYEKLVAYRDVICDLVTYNTSAAQNGSAAAGIDPWQIIYVFDGNSSTNVVCEGYSKAFQYLCDKSTFSGDTTCYTVSGVTSFNGDTGNHMWNIVSLRGKNYMADITNSDSGAIGFGGGLFLSGYSSGTASTNYWFSPSSYNIGYIYDSDTIALFDINEVLTLSDTDYDPSTVVLPAPTPSVTSNESTGKPVLTWASVDGAETYQVYRAASENGEYTLLSTVTDTELTDSTTTAGTTYYYKVRALAADASASDFSDIVYRACTLPCPSVTVSNRASDGKPYISWTAVDGATGYQVYRSDTSDGTYSLLYTASATKLNVTHTGAKAGNDYFYKVVAVYGDNNECNSAMTAAEGVWCDLPRPSVTVSNRASDGKPYISWAAVDGATGYQVYRCGTSGGSYTLMYTASATKLNVTHTGAVVGNDYFYKVIAVYGDNTECNSAMSTAKGVWCDLKRPTVKVTNRASDGKPYITWNAVDGAAGYKVYRCDTSTGTYKLMYTAAADRLYVTHTGAVAGNDYFYKVQAIHSNSKCDSALSSYKGVWCDLARPTLTVTLNSKGKPYLSWTEVNGADSYKLYRSTDGENYTLMYTASADDFDVNHTGAVSGTTYYYKVMAVCDTTAKANSAYSAVKSITSK